MPILIIERMKPADEHDRQKWYRLVGKVEGSPESTWKTASIPMAQIAQKGKAVIDARKARLGKDVLEYWANYQAANDVENDQ